MSFPLTEEEWNLLANVPESHVVDLAAELDLVPAEQIDKRGLVEACIPRILERAREEGLPFSKYDVDDLSALPPEHLAALGRLQGLHGPVTVAEVLKVGRKVYRNYRSVRSDSAVALMLPMLLTAIARAAHSGAA